MVVSLNMANDATTYTHPQLPLVLVAEPQLCTSSLFSPSHTALSEAPAVCTKLCIDCLITPPAKGLLCLQAQRYHFSLGTSPGGFESVRVFTDCKNVNYRIKKALLSTIKPSVPGLPGAASCAAQRCCLIRQRFYHWILVISTYFKVLFRMLYMVA